MLRTCVPGDAPRAKLSGMVDTGLSGKVAFVSGASGGIGRAIVRAFAAEGAFVVAGGFSRTDELRELVRREGLGAQVDAIQADVRDPDALDQVFQLAEARHGPVEVCVACAGVWPAESLPLHRVSPERVRSTIDSNLLGSVWTLRAFARGLERRTERTGSASPSADGPSAVLIGSTAARYGERDHADYALAKAGLYGLLQSLKNELPRIDPGARCNLVEPGWTRTEMARAALDDPRAVQQATSTMALQRVGEAEDVARAVLTLASPTLSRHVTGQVVTVAGGMEGRLLWGDLHPPKDQN